MTAPPIIISAVLLLGAVCAGCRNDGGGDTLEEFERTKREYAMWFADAFCKGDDEEYERGLAALERFNEPRKEEYKVVVTWADVVEQVELRPYYRSGSVIPGFEYTEESRKLDRDCLIRAKKGPKRSKRTR